MKTTFLYNFINQFIYVKLFKSIEIKINYNIIYKFLKALYNFKQSF